VTYFWLFALGVTALILLRFALDGDVGVAVFFSTCWALALGLVYRLVWKENRG
jgi:hypothetical protein